MDGLADIQPVVGPVDVAPAQPKPPRKKYDKPPLPRRHGPLIALELAEHWLRIAPPGTQLVYHRGCVASDRELRDKANRELPEEQAASTVGKIAGRMLDAFEERNVDLVQRRTDDGYEYIGIKRSE